MLFLCLELSSHRHLPGSLPHPGLYSEITSSGKLSLIPFKNRSPTIHHPLDIIHYTVYLFAQYLSPSTQISDPRERTFLCVPCCRLSPKQEAWHTVGTR